MCAAGVCSIPAWTSVTLLLPPRLHARSGELTRRWSLLFLCGPHLWHPFALVLHMGHPFREILITWSVGFSWGQVWKNTDLREQKIGHRRDRGFTVKDISIYTHSDYVYDVYMTYVSCLLIGSFCCKKLHEFYKKKFCNWTKLIQNSHKYYHLPYSKYRVRAHMVAVAQRVGILLNPIYTVQKYCIF